MSVLRASAGAVDLKPEPGMWMTGYGARIHPAAGTRDPICARAVLLDNQDTQLVMVSCDLLGLSAQSVLDIRTGVSKRTSICADHILVSCTHTHSGPASLPMRGAMGHVDHQWLSTAKDRIIELVSSLPKRLEPACPYHASARVPDIGFNRQDESRAIDDELIVIQLRSEQGGTIATIANYATHAVTLGSDNLQFSADFPGAMVRRTEESLGGTAMYIQGASGDANPILHTPGDGWQPRTSDDVERIGNTLAHAAIEALRNTSPTANVKLAAKSKIVEVRVEPLPDTAEIDKMTSFFEAWKSDCAANNKPEEQALAQAMLDWADELREASQQNTAPRPVQAEIFTAAIGDVLLVALPFETYSGIALEIKKRLVPGRTLFAGYSNGLIGYCPTDWAKDQGGYGPVDSARWFCALLTPVDYGADELLINESVALARTL